MESAEHKERQIAQEVSERISSLSTREREVMERVVRGKPNLAGGYELVRGLLSEDRELPTAFVSYGSTMVVGAVRALEEAGLRVPEDVSLIGAGSRWFTNVSPRVTIVAAEAHLLGIESVKMLLARLAAPQRPPVKKLLPMDLLPRETTAAPGGKG